MTASDDRLPDTAMATGNDDGEPGEQLGGPLDEQEQAMLAGLTAPHDDPVVVHDAVEDSPAYARAVEDDSVVPED